MFNDPEDVAVGDDGNLYVADYQNGKLRRISSSGEVSTVSAPDLAGLRAVAVDHQGNLYVAESGAGWVRRIAPDGQSTVVIDRLTEPSGVDVDDAGNVYVSDYGEQQVLKVTPSGERSVLAGSGNFGNADGPALLATFGRPWGVSVDATGAVYVADKAKNDIRRIDPDGYVETIAGIDNRTGGFADGAGSTAKFDNPLGIASDGKGIVYVGDSNNQRIRKIAGMDGVPAASSVTKYPLEYVYDDGIPAVCWAHDGPGRCSVRVKAGGKVIAKADADLKDGERRTLRPRVTSSAIDAVKRRGKLLATVSVTMNGVAQPGWKPLLTR
jgi:sugar lactone lactonase YvrE